MENYSFEDLPKIIGKVYEKLDKIEKLLGQPVVSDQVEEDLMTIEGASKLLSLSVATIYTKVCKNEIPVNKKGKKLYFYRSELLDWIKSGRIKTVEEIEKEVEKKFNSTRFHNGR